MNVEIQFTLPVLFITIPIIMTWIVYFITYKFTKHRWKAIHISVQATAIFYIIAVTLLLQKYIQFQLVGIILIFLITLLSVNLIIQRKRDMEVILGKGIKVVARFSFLFFGCLYLVLISYEIIHFIAANI